MNRITKTALAVAAVASAGGLIAATAHAGSRWQGERGYHDAGEKRGGHDRMFRMFETFDANGDGALTQDEIDTARAGRMAQFDVNGDKALTLDEYQALWLDAMRERMVRAFQRLDTDGDANVTATEFEKPLAHMVARADHNEDGKIDSNDRPRHGMRHGDGDHEGDQDDGDRHGHHGQMKGAHDSGAGQGHSEGEEAMPRRNAQ